MKSFGRGENHQKKGRTSTEILPFSTLECVLLTYLLKKLSVRLAYTSDRFFSKS